ncbi:TPA: hypothetical protein N0F65_003158 [Lagenidium giganteum]|uniref:ABC transporter domain-containing protein n=1 Tax=Lagenidium giganteum TaxID=4803 RepID=A0AAV2ZAP3_9STRA|nr:TPA: hypothetical protein N0F65_003158 [Lagenidium giganteum]
MFVNATSPSNDVEYEEMHDLEAATGLGITKNLCTLSWSNITYTVSATKTKDKTEKKQRLSKKTILKNVTGRCAPGELVAVMGPSGSGKTTLLDILADRIRTGRVDGSIELNGKKRNIKTFRAVTSYVAQEDALLGSFTVAETLVMAAKLSLPSSITNKEIRQRVLACITEMGLESCRNTLVGTIFSKGISGGQKRRLSIAIELLANPSVLLLDEPTSGLDSSSTFNVMKFIARLCKGNKTVVCTIHQPSSLVYNMFSHIMVLTAGETIYFGPREHALEHFATLGYTCPMYSNPAEYFTTLVNADFEGHADIEKLAQAYAASATAAEVATLVKADRHESIDFQPLVPTPPSPFRQFCVLMHRNSLNNLRNPGIFWVRYVMYTILSLMAGTMYLSNDAISDQDMVSLLFALQAFLVFMSVAVLPFFIEQRAVFVRERANNALNVVSYVSANFLAALPGIFFISLTASLLVVLLAGVHGLAWYVLNLFLSLVVAESLMHVIGGLVSHYIKGIAIGAAIYGMFMLCEGFMVPHASIPDYWIWAYYLAFHTYSFESFVYQHFSAVRGVKAAEAHAVLVRLGMTDVNVPRDMCILLGYAIGLQLIYAIILHKFHTGRR